MEVYAKKCVYRYKTMESRILSMKRFFLTDIQTFSLKWCEPGSVLFTSIHVHPSISLFVRLLSAVSIPPWQQLQYSKNQTSGPALKPRPSRPQHLNHTTIAMQKYVVLFL